jgi:flagella basal body P-ring formation protein FlgA
MPEDSLRLEEKIDRLLDGVYATIDVMSKNLTELTTIIKGYNGYKGIAQTVQENTGKILSLQACIEPLTNLAPTMNELKVQIDKLKERPGNTALKWLNRIGVALLGAAAVAGFTLWINSKTVQQIQIIESTRSGHIVPSSHP